MEIEEVRKMAEKREKNFLQGEIMEFKDGSRYQRIGIDWVLLPREN